jgi:cytochrome c553
MHSRQDHDMNPLPLLLIAGLATGLATPRCVHAQAATQLATQVCATCHGRDGNSISPLFPRLAGQTAAYLEAQLKSFRARTRADPAAQAFMWGMAAQLDDGTIHELAAHYAAQTPRSAAGADPALFARGKAIYERGSIDGKVAACQTCHGAQAQGADSNPRLAGQHPDYLSKQLALFKSRLRANDPVMVEVCSSMTPEQIEAVAAYAASR